MILKGINILTPRSFNQKALRVNIGFFLKFWASNKKRKLEYIEQKALTSFFIMNYIIEFSG